MKSIRGRMLLLSAAATVLALVVAGLMIGAVLGRLVTQGIDRRLDAQIALLTTAVTADGHVDAARLAQVRGALEAGPGWRWEIAAPDRTIGSNDFPRLYPEPRHGRPGPPEAPGGPVPRDGADGEGAPVHAREVTLASPAGKVVLRAAAPRAVIERPIHDAIVPLLFLLFLLSLVLAGAALLQLWYGLRPLRALRDAVAAVRSGTADNIPENQPSELRPLAEELNALLHDNHAALAAARASAANLAHALKTPVAALALELRDTPAHAGLLARIDATIRHHLSRARERITDRRARTVLSPAVGDLVATVARLAPLGKVRIDTEVDATLAVAVEPADFDEMLGNLLDNAVRHARGRVMVRAVVRDGTVQVSVEDDGPGIPDAARARAVEPGVRLDERGDGHGFGLAIARELAELYGGTLGLAEAATGGLAATLHLPISRR